MKILTRVRNILIGLWLSCVFAVFGVIFFVVYIRKELFDRTPSLFLILLGIFFFIGCLSFILMILISSLLYVKKINKNLNKKQNIFKKIIKLFVILAFFPIFSFINIFHPNEVITKIKKSGLKELFREVKKRLIFNIVSSFTGLIIVFFLSIIWVFGYFGTGIMIAEVLGFNPRSIPIVGTGSMYPTFPKSREKDHLKQFKDVVGQYNFTPYPNGLVLFNKRYFGYKLQRLDIVIAYNQKIGEGNKKLYGNSAGAIKRIIGLPGETLEIRNGLVYINGKSISEPYTAKPHSTFGEEFLKEKGIDIEKIDILI